MMSLRIRSVVFAFAAVALVFSAVGCTGISGGQVMDGAGMTKQQVEKMTAKQQFDLFCKRYERMQRMITEAQRAISTDTWTWGDKGFGATGGENSEWAMVGATGENSYYMSTGRNIELKHPERALDDPILAYFKSKGWKTEVTQFAPREYQIRAVTSDNFDFTYQTQTDNWNSLDLYSRVFWGDTDEIMTNVVNRIPAKNFDIEESKPGDYIAFPKRTDPIVNNFE